MAFGLEVETIQTPKRVAVIRTSDRQSYKRCRRRWGFSSHLKHNLDTAQRPSYFWLGTGCHFALEDYHGYNYYKHPVEAFRAYVNAQRKFCAASRFELPDDLEDQIALGEGMLEYYLLWLKNRDPLETLWVDGVPQVEVKCRIPLPIDASNFGYDEVVYEATIDRVVVIQGELWVLDYKFYKKFDVGRLEFDEQMSSYIWAASCVYDRPMAGAILQQHKKMLPQPPRFLASGRLSADKNQNTTYHLYREAIVEMYGEVEKAPQNIIDCLTELAVQEGTERDDYIRRDRTERNRQQLEATGAQILMEVQEMLNPETPLYKNATRDCSWDCSFSDICLMMDREDDWESTLKETTVNRAEESDSWRNYL